MRCADCGATDPSGIVSRLCACGSKLRTGEPLKAHCRLNPSKVRAEDPECVAEFGA